MIFTFTFTQHEVTWVKTLYYSMILWTFTPSEFRVFSSNPNLLQFLIFPGRSVQCRYCSPLHTWHKPFRKNNNIKFFISGRKMRGRRRRGLSRRKWTSSSTYTVNCFLKVAATRGIPLNTLIHIHIVRKQSFPRFFFNFWHGQVAKNPSTSLERAPLN